ncbi:RHS repeat-associated core domain-containing protein [Filimonas lacunae]|uniref:RHS repeat-associated core domain-containing protein n=1 Tax=Filimonas lacunae TaxID=477680 RepID=A0A173MGD1_9BACT|nr:DUF6531 domain-containing protein [Filimonas lacunae]BAV06478.1 Rhs-family protein [Filimonas lacunae]SIT27105.1 RHS repeat-associated core domain-containing protein [Filimonas lacunae]
MSFPKQSEYDKIKNAKEGSGTAGEEQTLAQKADQGLQQNAVTKFAGVADTFSGVHSTLSTGQDILTNDKASTGDKVLAVVNVAGNLAMQAMAAKQFVNNLVNKITEATLMPVMQAMAGPLKGIACLPIAKQMDPVMGIDVHFVTIPPAPAPIPMPHPYIGMIFNPKDWVAMVLLSVLPVPDEAPDAEEDPHGAAVQGAKSLAFQVAKMVISKIGNSTVKIGPVIPRAVAGTITKNFPHIPMGAGFHPAFMIAQKNHGYVFLGSLFVTGDGEPLASGPFINNDCWDIGAPALFRMTDLGRLPPMYNYVPSGFIMPIPWTRPILVNPVPTPINPLTIGERLFKFGLAKLKARKGTKNGNKNKPCSRASKALHRANEKLFGKFPGIMNKIKDVIGTHVGHPIDVAGGFLFTSYKDISFPGPIPLIWERKWYSNSDYCGPLGYGWHHSYDMALVFNEEEGMAIVRLEDGRTITFDQIPLTAADKPRYHRGEKMFLGLHEDGFYYLRTAKGRLYNFSARSFETRNQSHLLTSVANADGFAVRLHYSSKGWLQSITDTAGRLFTIDNDTQGRIVAIHAPDPNDAGKTFEIARYYYDDAGDMICYSNALQEKMLYVYQHHLLVQETWRNGQQWFFRYDGTTTGARCIETWGTDDLLHYKVKYVNSNYTLATNSLGHATHYYHQNGLVHKTVDARGGEWHNRYNEFDETEWITDPLGNQTGYRHDQWGNVVSVTRPDGQFTQIEYFTPGFPHLPSEAVDARGAKWKWLYDNRGHLVKQVNPLQGTTVFTYTDGMLESVTNGNGGVTRFSYNRQLAMQSIQDANGAVIRYEYDLLARCLQVINPKGGRKVTGYDLLGRATSILEFTGNLITLQYDGSDNIVVYRDNKGEITYNYTGLGRLSSRKEAGTVVQYQYDTENQLRRVVNEHGIAYTYVWNSVGEVMEEVSFDGMRRTYDRNLAGWVTRVNRPAKRFSEYGHDSMGRITTVTFHDGTSETYEYDNGLLYKASNHQSDVIFEHDISGNVLSAVCNGVSINNVYDMEGRRTALQSSLGADMHFELDMLDNVTRMNANGWQATLAYDVFGLESEAELPGGIQSKWQRDKNGLALNHWVGVTGLNKLPQTRKNREYRWDDNEQLRSITDSLSGIAEFDYDLRGNLIKATYGNGIVQHRNPDKVGNLFETENRTDRVYGKAGQLKNAKGWEYRYDEEGYLTEKQKGLDLWKYEWHASGMLSKVVKPDGSVVTFGYDALGRRIWKKYRNTITRWIWDGANPLHEWKEHAVTGNVLSDTHVSADGVITWVFNEDSFTPIAKLKGQKKYSIIVDHLGTPFQMYNDEGVLFWEGELDSYGRIRLEKGDAGACPFRFQGQYEDKETGLYYNRFRYYASEEGMYISQDPIRLNGGMALYGYVHDTTGWLDVLGLAKKNGDSCEVYVRHLSEKEAEAIGNAKGLVPDLKGRKAKWIYAMKEKYIPSKQKTYTHKVEFEMKEGTGKWMKEKGIDWDDADYKGEAQHPDKVIFKSSNEPGAAGVGIGLLDDFNEKIVKIKISKL